MIKLNKVECHKLNNLRQKFIDSNSPVAPSKNPAPEKENNAINAYKIYVDYLHSLGEKYGFKIVDIDTIFDDGEVVFKVGTVQSSAPISPGTIQEAAKEALASPDSTIASESDVILIRKMNRFFVLTGVRIMKYFDGKQFKCPNCDKSYGLASDFMDHIQSSELEKNAIGNFVLKKRTEVVS